MRDGFEQFPWRRLHPAAATFRARRADAERLLDVYAPGLSADLRSRFLREASGNPLALVELPRGANAAAGDAPWLPLTDRLERAFSSRLSDLPHIAQLLLFVTAENDGTSLHEILSAGEAVLGERVGIDAIGARGRREAHRDRWDGGEVSTSARSFRHASGRRPGDPPKDPRRACCRSFTDQLDRQLWHRAAATIGPDDELAGEYDLMAARALRRGAVAMAIEVLESAARLSSTAKAERRPAVAGSRTRRRSGAAGALGAPAASGRHRRDRTSWRRSGSAGAVRSASPRWSTIPRKIPHLIGFAAQAHAAGAIDLAAIFFGEPRNAAGGATQASELRARVLDAADAAGIA